MINIRPKKEPRTSFGSTLNQDLMVDLRTLSDVTGVPISKLLDEAVTLLLEQRGLFGDTKDNEHEIIDQNSPKMKTISKLLNNQSK